MGKVEEVRNDKILDINDKLDTIHLDIKRLIERSNKEYLDLMLDNLKKDI